MPLDQALFDAGLKLQAAIPVSHVRVALPSTAHNYAQLIVLGHAGPDYFTQTSITGENPLDDRAVGFFERLMTQLECRQYEIVYPTHQTLIDLRALGAELGWQSDSQLGLGIHPEWGTWFAYRLVALADTEFPETQKVAPAKPCDECLEKPCLAACPASATGTVFGIDRCVTERVQPSSRCADNCVAREACPVGRAHQYSREQIAYHAKHSLHALKDLRARQDL